MVKIYIFWQKPPYSYFLITFIGIKNTNQLETQFLGGCKMPCLPSFFPKTPPPPPKTTSFSFLCKKPFSASFRLAAFVQTSEPLAPKVSIRGPKLKPLAPPRWKIPKGPGFAPKRSCRAGAPPSGQELGRKDSK